MQHTIEFLYCWVAEQQAKIFHYLLEIWSVLIKNLQIDFLDLKKSFGT